MRNQTTFLDWDGCQKKLPNFITDIYGEDTSFEEITCRKEKRVV